jgi:hypothetical protein
MIKINDTTVEISDLQHYISTQKEYPRDIVLGPIVDITNLLPEQIDVPDIIDTHIHIDNQNVHESSIQDNVKNTHNKILKTQQDIDIESILAYIDQQEQSEKIKDILSRILKRNSYLSNISSTETDAIKNVWNNSDNNVKEQLMKMLLDCEDSNGQLYCPTGVVTRVTSALHVNNPENWPKSKDILGQEVLSTFGKYFGELGDKGLTRQRVIDSYSKLYKPEIITGIIDSWIEFI